MENFFAGLLITLSCAVFSANASDSVASAPIIQGSVSGLALDANGNRYVTGSFYDARDFNPGLGADVKTPIGWTDLFVTRFNADGTYAWTQTVGAADSSFIGSGIVTVNGTVYVCGERYHYTDPATLAPGATPPAASNAIVIAFDATTGALKKSFGDQGIAAFAGIDGATAAAITASGSTLYVTGIQYPDYIHIAVDPPVGSKTLIAQLPTSKTFVWSLDAVSGAPTAAFGSGGVVTLDDLAGENSGRSIALADGSLFATGTVFNFASLPVGVTPLAASAAAKSNSATSSLLRPYFFGSQNAFVASLNPTTGALNSAFAGTGIKSIGGGSVSGNGLAVANGVIYITGGFTLDPAITSVIRGGAFTVDPKAAAAAAEVSTDVFVLALDATTGTESSTFGTNGMIFFGRQFYDEGVALAVSSGTVYVTGSYGNLTQAGGFFYPLAGGSGPVQANTLAGTATKHALHKNGPPAQLNGSASGSTPSNGLAAVNNFGIPNRINGAPGAGASMFIPIGGFGGGGLTDAFVLALDATTGARKTNFSGDGLQTFGGSSSDGGVAIAATGSQVVIAGYSYSTDAGIGGLGTIDATGFNSFLLTLDTATGGGGGAEQNTAPIVHAGDPQTAALPQNPKSDFNQGNFDVYLDPIILDDGLPNPPGALTIKWEQVSGPGTVTFDVPTNAFTGANFSAPGVYVLRVTASDSVLSASDTTTVTVTQNHAPIIDSAPHATPSPAVTGQNVAFSVAAHDPDNDDLNYFWDYGDNNYDYDAATTHAYLAPGTYTVVLHVDDGVDETVSKFKIVVTGDPIFQVDDLQFCVDFSGKGHSTLRVGGVIGGLPKNFNPANVTVNLNSGGAAGTFTLDKNGRAKNKQGTFTLTHKAHGWSFSAKLNSASIDTASLLPDGTVQSNALGLANVSGKHSPANVAVTLGIGAMNFNGNKVVTYSTSNGLAKGK